MLTRTWPRASVYRRNSSATRRAIACGRGPLASPGAFEEGAGLRKCLPLARSEIEPFVPRSGLAAVKADARSESRRIDTDRRRRGNLVGGQTGAVDDREGAVRAPRGGRSVNVARRGEAGTPEADAITAGNEAVARDVRTVGGPGIGRESGERSRHAVAGEAVARAIKPGRREVVADPVRPGVRAPHHGLSPCLAGPERNNRPAHDGCQQASHELESSGDKVECLPWRRHDEPGNHSTGSIADPRLQVYSIIGRMPGDLGNAGSECTLCQHEDQYPNKKPL